MSSVAEVEHVPSPATTAKSRWKYFTAGHWAKSAFPPADRPVSDSQLLHSLQPYHRESARDAWDETIPQIEVPLRRRSLWLLAAWVWRGSQGWLASAALHASAFFIMATLTLPSAKQHEGVFLLGSVPAPGESRLQHVELKSSSPAVNVAAAVAPRGVAAASASSFELPNITDPARSSQASQGSDNRQSSGEFGQALAMLAGDRDIEGIAQSDSSAAGANFFGVHAAGKRFVFVVDCSLSMAGPKWQTASLELLDAIDRLNEEQFFYVIFFDGDTHPMFNQSYRISAMEQATPDNIQRLKQWLGSVRLGYNTSPCQSVKHAVKLQPDAVFLLSDGDFNDFTAGFLRKRNHQRSGDIDSPTKVVVHTICFRSRNGQKVLQRIANENGGTYRFVP